MDHIAGRILPRPTSIASSRRPNQRIDLISPESRRAGIPSPILPDLPSPAATQPQRRSRRSPCTAHRSPNPSRRSAPSPLTLPRPAPSPLTLSTARRPRPTAVVAGLAADRPSLTAPRILAAHRPEQAAANPLPSTSTPPLIPHRAGPPSSTTAPPTISRRPHLHDLPGRTASQRPSQHSKRRIKRLCYCTSRGVSPRRHREDFSLKGAACDSSWQWQYSGGNRDVRCCSFYNAWRLNRTFAVQDSA